MAKRFRLRPAYKWFLIGGGTVVLAWLAFVWFTSIDCYGADPISRDIRTLQILTAVLSSADPIPLDSDGRVDLFALITGEHEEDHLHCFSLRRDTGPSAAELAARDYRNFPWARAVGPIDPKGPSRPLLWEPEPMPDGMRLVAFTNGSAKALEEAEFQKLGVR